jgi:hypothetical protein
MSGLAPISVSRSTGVDEEYQFSPRLYAKKLSTIRENQFNSLAMAAIVPTGTP